MLIDILYVYTTQNDFSGSADDQSKDNTVLWNLFFSFWSKIYQRHAELSIIWHVLLKKLLFSRRIKPSRTTVPLKQGSSVLPNGSHGMQSTWVAHLGHKMSSVCRTHAIKQKEQGCPGVWQWSSPCGSILVNTGGGWGERGRGKRSIPKTFHI